MIGAGIAQLVEYELPKLGVAGSSPVARSMSENLGCAARIPHRTVRPLKDPMLSEKGGVFFMMDEKSRELIQRLWEIVEPVVISQEMELAELEFRREPRGWVLRLYIDRMGGVTLEDCTAISREVGDLLDVKDPILHPYHLEVSSPGLERPLRKRSDFEKFTGKPVKVTLREPRDNRRVIRGALAGMRGELLRVQAEDGLLEIPLDAISKARLVYDWGAGIGQGVK
jgi:ribosome maturation factor RimP